MLQNLDWCIEVLFSPIAFFSPSFSSTHMKQVSGSDKNTNNKNLSCKCKNVNNLCTCVSHWTHLWSRGAFISSVARSPRLARLTLGKTTTRQLMIRICISLSLFITFLFIDSILLCQNAICSEQ